jgi:energy-coupling factor transporter ATP-binding protein EcfA2
VPKIYFIIGVNGVGKSTLIPHLRPALAGKSFVISDFDERGVPDDADAEWRKSETRHWLSVGKENLLSDTSTIICGFSKPEEIRTAAGELEVPVSVILLDADAETITRRIHERYVSPESQMELTRTTGKTPEKFAADNVWISSKFREDAARLGYEILDTSRLSPEDVSRNLLELISA